MNQDDDATQQRRALIYGSCVTRDAFQLDGLPALHAYFARSPILSAFGPRVAALPDGLDLAALSSSFQRSMVQRDIQKVLPAAMRALDDEVVIIDFIDERFSVVEVNGGVIAMSVEAKKAGLTPRGGVLHRPTDPGFMDRWRVAADRMASALEGKRVILNKAYWALQDETGAALSDRFDVNRNNEILAAMFDHLEGSLDSAVIEYPADLLTANSQHRWGLSPFHYVDSFYEHFAAALRTI